MKEKTQEPCQPGAVAYPDRKEKMGILMPKATAVWLIDNTSLTFEQIADFCGLHLLEVNSMADGESAETIRGADPVAGGELTREEIQAGEGDSSYRMKAPVSRHEQNIPPPRTRRKVRYTPISSRTARPNAILWFLRNHAEISDTEIVGLIGTTRNMINQIRKRTHRNIENIKPVDPVTLGLCSQVDLDAIVAKSTKKREQMEQKRKQALEGPGLQPLVEEAVEAKSKDGTEELPESKTELRTEISAEDVFGNFDSPGN